MPDIVLVRAFRGKPLKREAVGSNGRLVYVAAPGAIPAKGINKTTGVGFPAEDVYCFNSMAYESLSAEFGRTGEIGRAEWREKGLERYRP